MTNDFDLAAVRAQLDALRTKFGADTPAGHRCSNLIEQLKNLEGATGEQRKHLEKNIAASVADLAKLSAAYGGRRMTMRAARWSDNERYLGPFTFSFSDCYRTLAICLRSSDDEDRATTFRLSIGRWSFLSVLPGWVIRPERKKVYPQWDEATVARLGRDWYWDITPREYSVGVFDGHLSIRYGRVTHDSSTEQQWGCFLPWTQWRHVRRSFYDLSGKHFWSEIEAETQAVRKLGGKVPSERWEIIRKWEEMCPKAKFLIEDFDAKEVTATTHVEEREWRFGTGYFKWLSLFRRPKIRRTLDINFSDETGPEKGSWKGGTIGTGIEMLPGEDHEAAFRRYCDQEHRSKYRKYSVKFVSRVA